MLTINEILRAQNVKRWSLVATTRPQSIAEHTFNVTMIARSMCKSLGIPDELVIKAALEHDLDECITGDIPSPTKRRIEQMGFDFGDLEVVKKNYSRLDADSSTIVKCADLIDAIHFLQEFGTGRRARDVEELLRDQLQDIIESLALSGSPHLATVVADAADEILMGEA